MLLPRMSKKKKTFLKPWPNKLETCGNLQHHLTTTWLHLLSLAMCMCQIFLSQRHEIFILQSVRVSEDNQTISEDFRKLPRMIQSSEVSWCVWDRLKKNNPLGFFPFKIVESGIKSHLHGPFLSQTGSSLHSSLVNGSFKVTSSHLWVWEIGLQVWFGMRSKF